MYYHMSRVTAIVVRHLYLQARDLMRLFDVTYWPALDIILWGFGSIFMVQNGSDHIITATVISIFLWQITYRTNLEISSNILEEIWERNVMNLFCTPITFFDWVVGLMALSFIRIVFVFISCFLTAWFCFGVSPFLMGATQLFLVLSALVFSGWITGFLNASLVLYLGRKAQSFPWMFGWLWAPFCGAFYDINIMPVIVQKISIFIPMTYIFQSVRYFVETGEFHYDGVITCFWVGSIYMVVSMYLFYHMFEKSKSNGLSTLEV